MEAQTTGWVSLGSMSVGRRLLTATASPPGAWAVGALLVINLLFPPLSRWAGGEFGDSGFAAVVALSVFAIALAVVVAVRRNPVPQVNFAAGSIRVGGTITSFTALTRASVLPLPRRGGVDYHLVLATDTLRHAVFCVRSETATELTRAQREMVAEVIRRSRVTMPTVKPDRFDPKGKFAWMDQAGHLDREAAIHYVLQTPASGEPERTPPARKSIWVDDE
jgi:hypothetical protein